MARGCQMTAAYAGAGGGNAASRMDREQPPGWDRRKAVCLFQYWSRGDFLRFLSFFVTGKSGFFQKSDLFKKRRKRRKCNNYYKKKKINNM
jgi:hypothetical protein